MVRLVPVPGTDVGYANEGDQQSRPGHYRDCMGCCCLGGSVASIFPYCTILYHLNYLRAKTDVFILCTGSI